MYVLNDSKHRDIYYNLASPETTAARVQTKNVTGKNTKTLVSITSNLHFYFHVASNKPVTY